MHAVDVAADQWVPAGQRLVLCKAFVSTCGWQPTQPVRQSGWCLYQAAWDMTSTLWVLRATAMLRVQQATGNVGVIDFVVFFVFQFVQTTQATTIAHTFPLFGCHVCQCDAVPER